MSFVDRRRGLLDEVPVWAAQLMDDWAAWVKRFRERGGGCSSPAWSMMQSKKLGIVSHGTAVEPEMPEDIAAVDAALSALERKLKKSFEIYYLWYAPIEDKARRCRCDPRTFYNRVRKARRLIANSLETGRNAA